MTLKFHRQFFAFLATGMLACIAVGCTPGTSTDSKTAVVPEKTLYERLGGKPAINAAVGELWAIVAKDKRINRYFAQTDPKVFGGKLADFLCQASGGPCTYTGMSMVVRHTGMHISEADFNAMAEDASLALDRLKVPTKEKGEVMQLLASQKRDIVNR